MSAIKIIIGTIVAVVFLDFTTSLLTIVTDGLGFIISGFTFIPKIIFIDFFGELPLYFKYGLYSLFCIIIFVLVFKLYSIFK